MSQNSKEGPNLRKKEYTIIRAKTEREGPKIRLLSRD